MIPEKQTQAMVSENLRSSTQSYWLNQLANATNYNRWVFDSISSEVSGNVLEIGCGIGTFTRWIASQANHVDAIEIDPESAREASANLTGFQNVTVLEGDFLDFDAAASYDTVIMLDVLEHIQDDAKVLRKITQLLSPQGKFVAKVPAMPSLFGSMDRAVGHHRRYSRRGIMDLLERSELRPTRLWFMNVPGIFAWWLNGRLLRRVHPEGGQVRIFECLTPIIRRFEKVVPLPFGLSLVLIAQPGSDGRPGA